MNHFIDARKIKQIFQLVLTGIVNVRATSNALQVSRNTLKKYIWACKTFIITYPDRLEDVDFFIDTLSKPLILGKRYDDLEKLLPAMAKEIKEEMSTLSEQWCRYKRDSPDAYSRSQFNNHFSKWRHSNGIVNLNNRWRLTNISDEDLTVLNKWRRSSNRMKWEKAVTILGAKDGVSIKAIAGKIERSTDKVKEWIQVYVESGLTAMLRKTRKQNEQVLDLMEAKKANLMALIHETPRLHGINRASWSLLTLAEAYYEKYRQRISTSTISVFLNKEGYSFRKARETLTSPDPQFREKLANVTRILSALTPKQKFFSVDEFGPFSVKIKGGRSFTKQNELKTYPQLQRSKGCIICTAALELSENQVTHFYSQKKNTAEMIKLLDILLLKYQGQDKIFFSWDAASWHASKQLYQKIEEVNSLAYRLKHKTPLVELAPLPSSAQFLNVIESVFSGLAKAIIHNSDYQSADECKLAIDSYFAERNEHYLQFPKRAGNKIWGKELVIPVFNESHNCKDPKWR